jgi:sugar lactone lactonase YvrE
MMKMLTITGLLIAAALMSGGRSRAAGCDPIGNIQFICDVQAPEDFAIVPGSDWLLTSGNRPGQGAIRALHPRQKKIVTLFPAASVRTAHDPRAFPGCPGPVNLSDETEKRTFAIHGMYLLPQSAGRPRLVVVHHGARESIEAFDVDSKASPPALTWVGCVVGPPNATFNAVVALPDGGIAATNTRPASGPSQPADSDQIGAVWEWHAATGWRAVPGTDAPRINGLEVSKDGKTLYVSAWGAQTLLRVERGGADPKRAVLPMPFRIDNLRMMPDGSILAAGHGGTALCSCPTETWHVGRIDPRGAMSVKEIVKQPYEPGFGAATVAVQVGKEIWIGTNRGDRIGYFAAP